MIRHRTIAGLSLLCALCFCALAAAPGAMAAKGTTAFTCEPGTGAAGFKDAHCDEATSVKAEVKFVHKEITPSTKTEITGTNAKTKNVTKESTAAILHTVKAGVKVTIECSTVHSTGTLENQPGPPMKAKGTGVFVVYTGCQVTAPVNGKGEQLCQVPGGEIKTNEITSETKVISEAPEEMGLEFKPTAGTKFVEITLENKAPNTCTLAGKFPIEGTVTGTPGKAVNGSGATLWFFATAQEEKEFNEGKVPAGMQKLTFGGSPTLLTATETVKMKLTKEEEEKGEDKQNAITLTTTAT